MSQYTVKEAVEQIPHLEGKPLIDTLRSWMVITDLSFKDVLHLNYQDMLDNLHKIHDKVCNVLDVLDVDQLQETACRTLEKITVYSEESMDEDLGIAPSVRLVWDGSVWSWVSDPKLRVRDSSESYRRALQAAKALMEGPS